MIILKNTIFISDLSEEVGNLTAVTARNYRFEKYEFEEKEGEKFIVGKGKHVNLENNNTDIAGFDLLFSLINLVKGTFVFKESQKDLNISQMENLVSDEYIMKWVQEYGFPFDTTLSRNFNEFNLKHFRNRLAKLYSIFSLWKSIVNEDSDGINTFSPILLGRVKWVKRFKNLKDYSEIELLKEALADRVSRGADITINLIYDNDIKGFKFALVSRSLFYIAYYQLSALMTKPITDTNKKMKVCDYCSSIFWTNNSNRKYCSNCNRKTIWSRNNK